MWSSIRSWLWKISLFLFLATAIITSIVLGWMGIKVFLVAQSVDSLVQSYSDSLIKPAVDSLIHQMELGNALHTFTTRVQNTSLLDCDHQPKAEIETFQWICPPDDRGPIIHLFITTYERLAPYDLADDQLHHFWLGLTPTMTTVNDSPNRTCQISTLGAIGSGFECRKGYPSLIRSFKQMELMRTWSHPIYVHLDLLARDCSDPNYYSPIQKISSTNPFETEYHVPLTLVTACRTLQWTETVRCPTRTSEVVCDGFEYDFATALPIECKSQIYYPGLMHPPCRCPLPWLNETIDNMYEWVIFDPSHHYKTFREWNSSLSPTHPFRLYFS
jgi:hypothetical protein